MTKMLSAGTPIDGIVKVCMQMGASRKDVKKMLDDVIPSKDGKRGEWVYKDEKDTPTMYPKIRLWAL